MAATYPLDKLPYPVRDNYTYSYGSDLKRVGMDDGHGRPRRRWDQQPMATQITWRFDQWADLDYFESFIRYDCAQASGWFIMPFFPGDTPKTIRMVKYPVINFDDSLGLWTATASVEYVRLGPTGYSAKPSVLPLFPSSLPPPEKTNYQITRDLTVTRSNLPDGLANQRARFQEDVATFTASWLLTPAQLAVWESFVHDQLLGGLAPFRGYFANGKGLNLVRVNFAAAPKISENGAVYRVDVQCETRDIPITTELHYRGLDKLSLSDFITWNANVTARAGAVKNEPITYVDKMSWKLTRKLTDTYSFTAAVSVQAYWRRPLTESLNFAAAFSFNLNRPIQDTIVWMTAGQSCWNQYSDSDYVQFGYTADCHAFADEESETDSISYTETIGVVGLWVRETDEELDFVAGGYIKAQNYCLSDYCDVSYTIEQVADL